MAIDEKHWGVEMSASEHIDVEQAMRDKNLAVLSEISEMLDARARSLTNESIAADGIVSARWLREAAIACSLGVDLLERLCKMESDSLSADSEQ